MLTLAAVAYLIDGGWFVQTYFTHANDRVTMAHYPFLDLVNASFHDLQPAIASVVEHADPNDKISISRQVDQADILALFHTKTPPQDYLNTRIIANPHASYQDITSFGRFMFTPERINEADHLILSTDLRQPHSSVVVPHPTEAAVLNTALARCTSERHGHFVVLHCA